MFEFEKLKYRTPIKIKNHNVNLNSLLIKGFYLYQDCIKNRGEMFKYWKKKPIRNNKNV
jgi:hypothetical protein